MDLIEECCHLQGVFVGNPMPVPTQIFNVTSEEEYYFEYPDLRNIFLNLPRIVPKSQFHFKWNWHFKREEGWIGFAWAVEGGLSNSRKDLRSSNLFK